MRLVRASSRGVEAGVEAVLVRAGPEQHHDLLERAVARALADAVHRALDLARACEDARVGVGDREAEVVVAVDRDGHAVEAGDQLVEARR